MFQIDVTCDLENTQTPCSKELKLHDFMRANVMYAVCTAHEAHPTIVGLQKQCLQSNAVAVPAYAVFPSSVFLDTDVIIRFGVYKKGRDTFAKRCDPALVCTVVDSPCEGGVTKFTEIKTKKEMTMCEKHSIGRRVFLNNQHYKEVFNPYELVQYHLLPYSPETPQPSEDHVRVIAMLKKQATRCEEIDAALCFRTNGITPGQGSCNPNRITRMTDTQIMIWLASWGINPKFMKTETDLFWEIF